MWTYALLVDLSTVQDAIRSLAPHDDQDPVRLNAEAFVTWLVEMGEVLADGSLLRAYFFDVAPDANGNARAALPANGRTTSPAVPRITAGLSAESLDELASMTQCKVRHVTSASVEEALCGDLATLAEHKACDAVVILASPSSRLLDAIDDAQLRGTLVHAVSLEPEVQRDPVAEQEFRHECDSGRIVTAPEMMSWFEAPAVRTPAPATRSVTARSAATRVVARRADSARSEVPRSEVPRSEVPRGEAPRNEAPRSEAQRTDAVRTEAPRADSMRTVAPRTSRRLPEYAEDLPGGAARFYGSTADFRVPDAIASFVAPSADVSAGTVVASLATGTSPGVSEPLSERDATLIAEVADHIVGLMYADERDEVRANGMQGIPAHVDRRLLGAAKRAFGTLLDAGLKKELRRQLWMRC